MKNLIYGFLFSIMLSTVGCRLAEVDESIAPITDPEPLILVERDSMAAGGYLGIQTTEDAKSAYAAVQALLKSQGVGYLNIVGNSSADISQLKNRLPLYSYIVLDQSKGTDSGVQITLEAGKVKNIFLTSGEELSQWPKKENANASIRLGDEATELHEKLTRIRGIKQYAATFERIMMLTKDLSTPFDPDMAQSSQWYFAYTTAANLFEVVNVHLKNGKVASITVERYKK
jgi:hypothetical protein